jgi:hypothetical protein
MPCPFTEHMRQHMGGYNFWTAIRSTHLGDTRGVVGLAVLSNRPLPTYLRPGRQATSS